MALVEREIKAEWGHGTRTVLDWSVLAPGDEVAVVKSRSYHGAEVTMFTVERVTATLVIMADGSRWYRKDGRQVAGDIGDMLRHPQDGTVIDAFERAEDRMFRRALEGISKRKTTNHGQMLTDVVDTAKLITEFRARITALEGKRRPPRAE